MMGYRLPPTPPIKAIDQIKPELTFASLVTTLGSITDDSMDEKTLSESPKKSTRVLVAGMGVAGLASVSAAAWWGLLPGVPADDGSFDRYTLPLIAQDAAATIVTAVLAYIFVKVITSLAERGRLDPKDSRKLIHTFSAPLFIACWPIFSPAVGARAFAAIVPLLNALRLYLAAQGKSETSLASAVSRSGSAQEALQGPFLYVIILAVMLLGFWRSEPAGIIALSCLAAGDGVADLIGRRWGRWNRWPGLQKSVIGSLAFWTASTATAYGLLEWLQYWDCLSLDMAGVDLLYRLAGIALAAAILELIPWADDNLTVPIAAALLSVFLVS